MQQRCFSDRSGQHRIRVLEASVASAVDPHMLVAMATLGCGSRRRRQARAAAADAVSGSQCTDEEEENKHRLSAGMAQAALKLLSNGGVGSPRESVVRAALQHEEETSMMASRHQREAREEGTEDFAAAASCSSARRGTAPRPNVNFDVMLRLGPPRGVTRSSSSSATNQEVTAGVEQGLPRPATVCFPSARDTRSNVLTRRRKSRLERGDFHLGHPASLLAFAGDVNGTVRRVLAALRPAAEVAAGTARFLRALDDCCRSDGILEIQRAFPQLASPNVLSVDPYNFFPAPSSAAADDEADGRDFCTTGEDDDSGETAAVSRSTTRRQPQHNEKQQHQQEQQQQRHRQLLRTGVAANPLSSLAFRQELANALVGCILGDEPAVLLGLALVVNHHLLSDLLMSYVPPHIPCPARGGDYDPRQVYVAADDAAQNVRRYNSQQGAWAAVHYLAARGGEGMIKAVGQLIESVDRRAPHYVADDFNVNERSSSAARMSRGDQASRKPPGVPYSASFAVLPPPRLALVRLCVAPTDAGFTPLAVAAAAENSAFLKELLRLSVATRDTGIVEATYAAALAKAVAMEVVGEAAASNLAETLLDLLRATMAASSSESAGCAAAPPHALLAMAMNCAVRAQHADVMRAIAREFPEAAADPRLLDSSPVAVLLVAQECRLPLTAWQKQVIENHTA